MPQVDKIDVIQYDVPLKSALAWGKGHQLAQLNHCLIRVFLSNGAVGIAEATPRPTIYGETQRSVQAIVLEHLEPIVRQWSFETKSDLDVLDRDLATIKNNHTAKGALNMALHDALARSQGKSLTAYMGVQQEVIRVSYIVGTGTDDSVYQDVKSVYESGVRVFKMKIGKRIPEEIALIQRLQDDFADAEFYADANQCLDSDTAPNVLDQLHAMDVLYCEESLLVHQLHARQALHQQTKLPLIADDSAFSADDLAREIAFDTFDLVNIKTARTGFSQSWRMCEMARHADKTIMVGSQASSLFGAMHTALFAGSIRAEHATECTFFLKTTDNLFGVPPIENGYLSIADAQATLNQWVAPLLQ